MRSCWQPNIHIQIVVQVVKKNGKLFANCLFRKQTTKLFKWLKQIFNGLIDKCTAPTAYEYERLYGPGIDKNWSPVLEITRLFTIKLNSSFQVKRRQTFPVQFSAAKTMHKDQG